MNFLFFYSNAMALATTVTLLKTEARYFKHLETFYILHPVTVGKMKTYFFSIRNLAGEQSGTVQQQRSSFSFVIWMDGVEGYYVMIRCMLCNCQLHRFGFVELELFSTFQFGTVVFALGLLFSLPFPLTHQQHNRARTIYPLYVSKFGSGTVCVWG